MNPSSIFIHRPIATTLLMLAILLSGAVAYTRLAVSALPEVDYPTIQVQTFYPGASPDVMTTSVTAPLERQFGEMPGLNQMMSTSSGGVSVITLQFGLFLSLDIAEQEVQAAINAAGNLLPADLPAPPIYAKVNPADAPVLALALTSKTMPLTKVQDIAETRLAQKISQLQGVGLVSLSGGHRPAVRIQVNTRALSAYGLNIDDVRTTLSNANVNSPKGNFDGPSRAFAINANDQLPDAAAFRNTIIAYKNGSPVRLSDVASAIDGAENTDLSAWANTTPAIIMNIQRQPGANVIKVVDGIKALLPTLQAGLPSDVELRVLSDRTTTIRASVADAQFEFILAVALVVMVIFLFLRSLPATFIPSLSVPLSIIGTFGIMYLCGFSFDNLSVMALTIATGFVVDDAIVVIENITRYIEEGFTPLEAALKGSEQIAFTIISLTISLLAVLIPLLFMGDVVGRLFHEFAITLAVTIVISAIVSLTLVPMLCARLLHADAERKSRASRQWSEHVFRSMIGAYGKALSWVLEHQPLTLFVALATLVLTGLLYLVVPKGFFPIQDTGLIQGISQATQSISFQGMAEKQQALATALLTDPNVESVSSFIGIDGSNVTLNQGRLLIALRPRDEREKSAGEIIRDLQKKTADIPGVELFMQPVQDLTIDDAISPTQYRFVLQNSSPNLLEKWVPQLISKLKQRPEIADIASDLQQSGLTVEVDIDRPTAARFGITPATVDNALYDSFGQRIVSTIFTQSNQYRVILEADPSLQKSVKSLSAVYLPSSIGGQVPLSAIATITERLAPLQISHLAQFPAATISFNLGPSASLGQAVTAIRDAENELKLPASFITHFQGAAQAFESSLSNEGLLILAAIVTMYIVLGVLYESFIHPITILSTLPSAGVGALIALIIAGNDLDIIGLIGIVLLIGIVKKNAIMMIDFALHAERDQGAAPQEAIYQACLLRFRPIMMTTMAALFAALPLVFGTGTGAELRRPLGIAIVGGLVVSQALTLFTTPVIYLAFDRLARRFDWSTDGSARRAAS